MESDSKIISQLEARAKEEGVLPTLLEFYLELLRIQSDLKNDISTPSPLPRQTVDEHIKKGVPLVSFVDMKLNWSKLYETCKKVIDLSAVYPELFDEIPQNLNQQVEHLLTPDVVKAWLGGSELPNLPFKISTGFWRNIIQVTLTPVLMSYSRVFIEMVNQEQWRRNYCPICGGRPDLAILDKETGARWLVCSRCDTRWLFQRLECPYCGCKDQNALSYYTDEKGLYRLYTCEKCKCYIKAKDQRQNESEIFLPLERLLTLNLDEQAQKLGYFSGVMN